jgi:hypothetical protein
MPRGGILLPEDFSTGDRLNGNGLSYGCLENLFSKNRRLPGEIHNKKRGGICKISARPLHLHQIYN